MTRAEYEAIPAVNYSLLKDLAVSPLRAWYKHVRPNREAEEPTPEMKLGTALHCAVLMPKEFDARYACELVPPHDALDTIEEIRAWIRSKGGTPKGTRKSEVIACACNTGANPVILETLQAKHAESNAGKYIVAVEDWCRLAGMAAALADEPAIRGLLSAGEPEKFLESVDQDTGLRLKGMLDWDGPDIVDLKTFSVRKGKTVSVSVTQAVWYEKYYLQAIFYSKLKGWPEWKGDYVLAFVESYQPHETRLRAIRPKTAGVANLLWEGGAREIRNLLRIYKDCMDHFGVDKPWRSACEVSPIDDMEIPGVVY
jgi:hypothetical protein